MGQITNAALQRRLTSLPSSYHKTAVLSSPCLSALRFSSTRLRAHSIEHLFAMARPPQYAYPENDSFAVAKVKTLLKELSPEGRAFVIAWLVKFYRDDGQMFSPQVTQRRKRVTIDDEEFWLVRLPKHP